MRTSCGVIHVQFLEAGKLAEKSLQSSQLSEITQVVSRQKQRRGKIREINDDENLQARWDARSSLSNLLR